MKQRVCLSRVTAILLFTACAFGLSAFRAKAQTAVAAESDTLTVMTYNLKFASPNPPNAWPQRRPLMAELIRQLAPDVLGTQEGLYGQLQELAADLPAFDWIGLGRDGGSRGEFMAVFYRTARLEPLAFDHFWLSDTPEVMGSKTWGPKLARMVTWVKFRDRQTKGEFVFINTHLDHQVQEAREKAAQLVRERAATFDARLPVLLVGDFNAAAGKNKAYTILTGDRFFTNTWTTARERVNAGIGTFNGFNAIEKGGAHIDWILYRGDAAVDRVEVVPFSREGQFPSDHCPVVAKMRLGASR
ncbi:MAG TPA: endonuclease/exonuclease/phosphatase family protein [Candidatus Paceibacterota bacterium]|nr:endonuclease/exonuclease/phosphatase family protein [Verrucomicrobiota bacterium]HSA08735.1 endonuclease/exonuclease/phosphatase family protein [Candidatus Paceibacterota bacterium]